MLVIEDVMERICNSDQILCSIGMLTLYFVKSASAVERGTSFTSLLSSGFVVSAMALRKVYRKDGWILSMKER